MQGFNPNVSLLQQGSGTITAMSGGGSAPFGFANLEQAETQKSNLQQISKSAKGASNFKDFYESLKEPSTYSNCKMEILESVMSAGILSSIKVVPDNTISSTHFNDIYSIRKLFDNLKERQISIEDIEIRFTADELEIELHSSADQTGKAVTPAGVSAVAAAGVSAVAATVPGATAAILPDAVATPKTLLEAAAVAPKALKRSSTDPSRI